MLDDGVVAPCHRSRSATRPRAKQIIRKVIGDERAGTRSSNEIALVQQLLVRAQDWQPRNAKIRGESSRRRNSLSRLQPSVQNGAAQSVIDLPENRNADAAVEWEVQSRQDGKWLCRIIVNWRWRNYRSAGYWGNRRVSQGAHMASTISIPD